MSYLTDLECPICKQESEFEVSRWNTEVTCPICGTELLCEFDMIVADDYSDEFDIFTLTPKP